MTYSVKTTDQNTTITVATGEVNTKYSVALVGRNVSGYGQFFCRKFNMDVGKLCKFDITDSKR